MDIMTKFGSLIIFSLGLLSLTKGQMMIVPADQNVKKLVNDSYFVSCTPADGSKHAEWFSPKGIRVDSAPQARIRTESLNGVELFINRITTQDGGRYRCQSTKSKQAAYFDLTVVRPITFDQSHAEQWAEEGRSHLLKCKALGQGVPTIHWRIDGKIFNTNTTKYTILKEGLMIHNVSQTDAHKQYVCRAVDISSPIPDSKQLNISLRVKIKPKIIGSPKPEHYGVVNEWANLTCSVNAEPKPRFEWKHRQQVLSPSDTVIIHTEDNMSILQVLVRAENTFGPYNCRVWNEMGQDERQIYLHKGRKPAVPKLDLLETGSHAAKIRVIQPSPTRANSEQDDRKFGRVLPITGIIVQYRMQTKNDWSPANISVTSPEFKEFVLNGLTPKVTYSVRAALKNQAAQGDFSIGQFNVRTLEHPTPISAALATHYSCSHQLYSILGILFNFVLVKILMLL
ncbi:unnamed protein product [Allacma fusca]|uniref:Ig-like domain-containing protein n=1 Tax=Allacma fusca TaxID=39272 RepID=A0A8J2L827_9HEXA|nr:unnamed protein product [Allacma fusca]